MQGGKQVWARQKGYWAAFVSGQCLSGVSEPASQTGSGIFGILFPLCLVLVPAGSPAPYFGGVFSDAVGDAVPASPRRGFYGMPPVQDIPLTV